MINKVFVKIKQLFEEYWLLLSILSVCIAIVFFTYIFGNSSYRISNSNDHFLQIPQFYQEYARLLYDTVVYKRPQFYSWNTFLGSDFYSSKLYYCVGSIFSPLLLIMKDHILGYMLLETILCIYISAIAMYIYLKEMKIENKDIRVIFSIVFALGGCATIQFCYPMFHRFYAFLPLLFVGIERYITRDKLSLFAIIVSILFLQNYYYMFPTTLILPLYFLFSCYIKDDTKRFSIIIYLKKSIKLILSYIIGFMVGAVVLIPGITFIMGNNRLSYNELSNMFTWPFDTWLGLIYYSFIPLAQLKDVTNPFAIQLHTDNTGVAYFYSLYSTVLSIIGINTSIFSKDRITKIYRRFVLIIFLMIMILPINSVLVAFTTPTLRLTFLLNFFLILLSAKGLCEAFENGIDIKKASLPILMVSIVTAYSVAKRLMSSDDIKIIGICLLMCLWMLICVGMINDKNRLVYLLVIIEIVVFGYFSVSSVALNYYEDSINKEYVDYFKLIDEDIMYRQYIDSSLFTPYGAETINLNNSQHYDFMGLSTYDSTYDNELLSFIKISKSDTYEHIINITNPNLFKLLGVKYVGVLNECDLDNINQYEYVYNLNHIQMFKLLNYNSIGHTYSEFVLYDKEKDTNIDVDNFDWNNKLIVENDLYNIVKDYSPNDKNQLIIKGQSNRNNFYGEIECNDYEVLFISIPYNKGWRFIVDGIETPIYKVNGGFIGVNLAPGYHFIDAWYKPVHYDIGLVISVIGLVSLSFIIFLDVRKS